MNTVTMYDATTPARIPSGAPAVAGYVDGRFAWKPSDWARFPTAYKITITVLGGDARVCDCENGDLTPVSAANWAKHEHDAGRRPTIYCSTSVHPQVVNALASHGLAFVRDVDWWEAHYDNRPVLSPGSVAKQYADPGPYDLNIALVSWLNPEVPVALNKPACTIIPTSSGQGYYIVAQDGGVFWFGDAPAHPDWSLASTHLNAPIVDAHLTPDGNGMWMLGADGGVFNRGNAPFFGSPA
jgi:hypothetical protein